jgi:hypothetical protein
MWDDVLHFQEAKEFFKLLPYWRTRNVQVSRVFEHMDEADAEEGLIDLGRTLAYPENRIEIVEPLDCEYNRAVPTLTAKYFSESFILTYLSRGARLQGSNGRIRVYRWERYRDLANEFTSLTVRAEV